MDKTTSPASDAEDESRLDQEPTDVSAAGVAGCGLGLLVGLALIMAAVSGFSARLLERHPNSFERPSRSGVAIPLPAEAEEALRDGQHRPPATLDPYRWVDRSAGVVAIPITRAMELIVERGLPAEHETGKTRLEMQQQKADGGTPR